MQTTFKKYDKNYYDSPYPDRYFTKRQRSMVFYSIIALVLFVIPFVLYIVPGYDCVLWIADRLELMLLFMVAYVLSFLGLVFCNIKNFFSYKLRQDVLQKDAPLIGFSRMAYLGQLVTFISVSLLAFYMLVLTIGYPFVQRSGYIAEVLAKYPQYSAADVDVAGIVSTVFYLFSALFCSFYYFRSYTANRTMQFVQVEDDPKMLARARKAEGKQKKQRVITHSVFGLTDQEIETGKVEFVAAEETTIEPIETE